MTTDLNTELSLRVTVAQITLDFTKVCDLEPAPVRGPEVCSVKKNKRTRNAFQEAALATPVGRTGEERAVIGRGVNQLSTSV